MVLQSQARLPAARTAHMYRRGGNRRKFMPAIFAIAILSITGWGLVKLWPSGSSDPGIEFAAVGSDTDSNQEASGQSGNEKPEDPATMIATVNPNQNRQDDPFVSVHVHIASPVLLPNRVPREGGTVTW